MPATPDPAGSAPPAPAVDGRHRDTLRSIGRVVLAEPSWPPAIEGTPAVPWEGRGLRPRARSRTDALVRLFATHDVVDSRELAERVHPLRVVHLEECGLVERSGTSVTARFGIERWGGIAVLHDWPEWRDGAEYVMGVTNAARSLAWCTPMWQVGSVLDLGTGSGIQALCAATHAERVVAVDVNPRSVGIARASVQLNGADNVEVREGSWFEPVEGEVFDLAVSNPPFVISPENRLVYRDGGMEGDALCGALLADLPVHLAPRGRAVMLVEWARRTGEEWSATPLRWLAPLGCDAIAVRYGETDPLVYATRWNHHLEGDPAALRRTVRAWVAEYERLRLDQMYEGVICVRRPESGSPARPHTWALTANRHLEGPAGAQLADVLDGHVATENVGTEELAELSVEPVEGHHFDQELAFAGGEYVLGSIRGGFRGGAGVEVELNPEELTFLLTGEPCTSIRKMVAAQGGTGLDLAEAVDAVCRLACAGLVRLSRDGNSAA